MKRIMLLFVCLSALAISVIAQTPEAQPQTELTKQLLLEVKKLRLELLQQRIEFQQWKIQQIERELQQARAEAERLEEEGRAIGQELAALSASTDQQKEGDSLKAETGRQLQKLQARQIPIRERVADLGAQQNREETLLRQLDARLKAETSAVAN